MYDIWKGRLVGMAATLALSVPVGAWSQMSISPIPDFTATALTGKKSALPS